MKRFVRQTHVQSPVTTRNPLVDVGYGDGVRCQCS
jgi:hypothetical protein